MNGNDKRSSRLATLTVFISIAIAGCVVNPVPTPGSAEMSAKSPHNSGTGSVSGGDGEFAQDAGMTDQGPSLSADATSTSDHDAGLGNDAD